MSREKQSGYTVQGTRSGRHRSLRDALRQSGRSKGGRRRSVFNPEHLKDFAPPNSAADLRALLAQSIIEIRTGKLDPKLANSISYLGIGFLRALEVSDLESRLAALEAQNNDVHSNPQTKSEEIGAAQVCTSR